MHIFRYLTYFPSRYSASIVIFTFFNCSIIFSSCAFKNYRQLAQEAQSSGETELAISLYKEHIQQRLTAKDRPEWENPWFYYLVIGDIFLKNGDIDKAVIYYIEAEKKGVKTEYVTDHIIRIALHYEEKEQYSEALKHLQNYKDRDPDFFNLIMDRIARKAAEST